MQFNYITEDSALSQAVNIWMKQAFVAIDTEFVRDKSYYPMLGLVQIAVDGVCHVIDLVSIKDTTPLKQLIVSPNIVKIIHACGEDVDALFHHFHQLPSQLFDTQMAAALLGIGPQVGYSYLVEHYFDKTVPKGLSRADWLARPLSEDLLNYAADDVAYLEAIYEKQVNTLKSRGLYDYFLEDCNAILDKKRYHPIPEDMYLKVKGAFRLKPKELAVLRELAAWRELKAREQNLPRNFIVKDAALLEIAKIQPNSVGRLSKAKDLHSSDVRRFGQRLLRCVELGLAIPEMDKPARIVNILDVQHSKPLLEELRSIASQAAESMNIPLSYLVNKKFLEQYILFRLDKLSEPPRLWRGWRKALLQDKFEVSISRYIKSNALAAERK
ncbi:MAG: ribonuclease D [Pseudomonadota bacterium]